MSWAGFPAGPGRPVLARAGFETGTWPAPRADRYSQITVRTNRYSVPVVGLRADLGRDVVNVHRDHAGRPFWLTAPSLAPASQLLPSVCHRPRDSGKPGSLPPSTVGDQSYPHHVGEGAVRLGQRSFDVAQALLGLVHDVVGDRHRCVVDAGRPAHMHPGARQAARKRISLGADDGDRVYDQNIQIAELNAFNATAAVIKIEEADRPGGAPRPFSG